MEAKEITMQVVRNLGNFETVRYSVTCTLTEGDNVDFKPIKDAIDREHARLYGSGVNKPNSANIAECTPTTRPLTFSIDADSEFQRVVEALQTNRVDMITVEQYYTLDDQGREYINKFID